MPLSRRTPELQRHAIRVCGAVQGVGFRPFVYRTAQRMGLTGWVLNDAQGVAIEVQGPARVVERFEHMLETDAPSLARVERVEIAPIAATAGASGFRILPSRAGVVSTGITPDVGVCDDCLAELFNRDDRRYRYAFINCTQCGPRYTIARSLPYDRAATSMAPFVQCPECQREYTDPRSRRFHAEPNACAVCGPALTLVDVTGRAIAPPSSIVAGQGSGVSVQAIRGEGDPIAATLAWLRAGGIIAIKGLGGFHLACDARNAAAVARLRERKHRDEKPFAVMCANLASVQHWAHANAAECTLLRSPERPIVLLAKRERAAKLEGVAPGLNTLGMMLPGTPIQYLLFHEAERRPHGTYWLHKSTQAHELVLVMTSANPGGEPLVTGNPEAMKRLDGIADAFLLHDRDIVARCDDSVLRVREHGAVQFIRRARGYVPRPIKLPRVGPPVLATGAWLKNTICVTRGDEAFLSPHIGDLDNAAACSALAEAVQHLCTVLDVKPRAVAHDLHPDFHSTRFARDYAAANSLPLHAVQHHHAHIAALAAEHGVEGALLGLALDGVGLGGDGSAWGGELLLVEGAAFQRLGHLAPLPMPGGDAAAREPWRMAAAALHAAGRSPQIEARFGARPAAAAVATMLARGIRCPPTTSMGRWFDAAAALLGVRETSAYEGQAAMMLEALAASAQPYPSGAASLQFSRAGAPLGALVSMQADGTLDPSALLSHLADLTETREPEAAAQGAALFHSELAQGLARWVINAATSTRVHTVALGGGCFMNSLLSSLLVARLEPRGIRVLQARQAPPNDGGIALGQAWVAICKTEGV